MQLHFFYPIIRPIFLFFLKLGFNTRSLTKNHKNRTCLRVSTKRPKIDCDEVQLSKTRKRENVKRENCFRVFNFILKFQKREFKIQKIIELHEVHEVKTRNYSRGTVSGDEHTRDIIDETRRDMTRYIIFFKYVYIM